ncbi:molecular chaperone [Vibrio sp. S4M6]|uniref:molecular chaperone n=1 Tax=Vibrio sinus TaxID=2946865 RepID=UPI00202A7CFA|nr:molecular chaperone [Vibrio sinus]MCL9782565.1 molecular chaperone [Vibrio sinus]
MYIGFDYGTASCSVATMQGNTPTMVPLEGDNFFIPSTLCAPTRESVSEYLYRFFSVSPSDSLGEQLLRSAIVANRHEGMELAQDDLIFGQAALERYLDDPEYVYYIKSPKSFLGANGLRDLQIRFFEDLVCAMMVNIKRRAESCLQKDIMQTVIGRPVNFQGLGGEKANQQAEAILANAAKRAGFVDIAFQFEPVAAGLDYESQLTADKTVLVVDIGGGTTDCSLMRMGPSYKTQADRKNSLLGHSGYRVGGNDLDIYLAFEQFMPKLGRGSRTHNGIYMPQVQFWNPIAINNIAAQTDFYMASNRKVLEQLKSEAEHPEMLERLLLVHEQTLGYQIVRRAEEAKVAMSDNKELAATLALGEQVIEFELSQQQLESAISNPVDKIVHLIRSTLSDANDKPDIIYVTGGSARSPILRALIEAELPGVPIVSGDYFGSVTAGLARYAKQLFA